jgi:ABC-type xylose transport system permease subunit
MEKIQIWGIVSALIWAIVLILLVTNKRIKDAEDAKDAAEDVLGVGLVCLVFSLVIGLSVGRVFGLVVGLVAGLGFSFVASLGAGLVLGLVFGLKFLFSISKKFWARVIQWLSGAQERE